MMPNVTNTLLLLFINLCILLYSLWLNKKAYKSYAYISLPFLFIFFMFFFHGLIQVYLFFSNNMQEYYSDTINFEYVTKTFIFATLFNLFFCIGNTLFFVFRAKLHFRLFKHIKTFSPQKILHIGLLIFLIGFFAKFLYMLYLGNGNLLSFVSSYYSIQLENAGEGGSFTNYLSFLFVGIEIGSDLVLLNSIKYQKHYKITAIVLILSLLISFNTRLQVMKLLLQYLIIVVIFNKKIRKKLPYIALIIFIPLMFSMLVLLGIYREHTNNKYIENINPIYFVLGSIHNMKTICDAFEHPILFGDYRYGKSILLPVIQKPIPRKIWKNKELNAAAIWTKTMRPQALEAGFSIAPGIGFDLYINFGYIMTLIFFLIFGYLLFALQQIIYEELLCNKRNILVPVIYAILISLMLTLRGTDVSALIIYMVYYIPIILLFFLNVRIKINN